MKKSRTTLIVTLLSCLFAVPFAYAAVQFKGKSGLTCTDNGTTLTVSGTLTGLGEQTLQIDVAASGTPTVVCINPSGKNAPPGQTPEDVDVSGALEVQANEFKNGNVSFSVETEDLEEIENAPDCVKSSWTERVLDIDFSSATVIFSQGGEQVFQATCSNL